jgi:hypothetical protein
VFLPILSRGEIDLVDDSAVVASLLQTIEVLERLVPTCVPNEERIDAYFVTTADFGLKFRHGKKLEIKVRTNRDDHSGCERFSKEKLGKKSLAEQMHKVLQVLESYGYGNQSIEHREILSNAPLIEVSKSRRCAIDLHGKLEVCHINLQTTSLSPHNWLSICVEPSSMEDLHAWMKDTLIGRRIVEALSAHVAVCTASQQLSRCPWLHPVIGGYPLWLKQISNPAMEVAITCPIITSSV